MMIRGSPSLSLLSRTAFPRLRHLSVSANNESTYSTLFLHLFSTIIKLQSLSFSNVYVDQFPSFLRTLLQAARHSVAGLRLVLSIHHKAYLSYVKIYLSLTSADNPLPSSNSSSQNGSKARTTAKSIACARGRGSRGMRKRRFGRSVGGALSR